MDHGVASRGSYLQLVFEKQRTHLILVFPIEILGLIRNIKMQNRASCKSVFCDTLNNGYEFSFDIRSIKERLTGKTEVRHLSENHFGSVVPSQPYLKAKKLADLLAAIVLLPIFLIVISIAALWIKYDSAGSVFFLRAASLNSGPPTGSGRPCRSPQVLTT